MLKKILSVLFFMFIVVGCSCDNIDPFKLEDKYYTSTEKGLVELESYDDIKMLIDDKESFAVYIYTPGCTSCAAFKPVLNKYIDENNLKLYSISYPILKTTNNPIKDKVKFPPSVVIYNEGKLVAYLDTEDEKHTDYFKNVDNFSEWFESYVIVSDSE